MNERRIEELYMALRACDECFKKWINRYHRERKVSELEESVKRLDAMQKYIADIKKELNSEIERRSMIEKGVLPHE